MTEFTYEIASLLRFLATTQLPARWSEIKPVDDGLGFEAIMPCHPIAVMVLVGLGGSDCFALFIWPPGVGMRKYIYELARPGSIEAYQEALASVMSFATGTERV